MKNKLLQSIKYIKPADLLAPVIFLCAVLPAFVYKLFLLLSKKHLWLIAEGENDARDNGYVLFEYIRTQNPEINAHYAIKRTCTAAKKIQPLGNLVHYGSFKHWLFYIAATKNITIHKAANPNPALFYVLHRLGIVNGHRIFLQHGITMNNVSYLHFNETRFELFVCGAVPEYKYVKDYFGFPEERVALLGFPRFDKLIAQQDAIDTKQIVIMPTWRSWLGREVNALGNSQNILDSEYFKTYQSLITNPRFTSFIEARGITAYFFQHANMERFTDSFSTPSKNICIVTSQNADIQSLIAKSALMITDYSSVSIDFAYMKKPLVYYQFDEAAFRSHHLSEGYFSYRKNGFGPVVTKEEALVDAIIQYITNHYATEAIYLKRSETFFGLRDDANCQRIVKKICELDGIKRSIA